MNEKLHSAANRAAVRSRGRVLLFGLIMVSLPTMVQCESEKWILYESKSNDIRLKYPESWSASGTENNINLSHWGDSDSVWMWVIVTTHPKTEESLEEVASNVFVSGVGSPRGLDAYLKSENISIESETSTTKGRAIVKRRLLLGERVGDLPLAMTDGDKLDLKTTKVVFIQSHESLTVDGGAVFHVVVANIVATTRGAKLKHIHRKTVDNILSSIVWPLAKTGKAPAIPATPAAPPEVVVKIGHVAPLTGSFAQFGKDSENGARLAIDDLNAQGIVITGKKLKFELMGENEAQDQKDAPAVAQRLVDAKVNAVVGHFFGHTTIIASKIYNDAGIGQISPASTNPTYTQQGLQTAFRLMTNDTQQGSALGNYAVKNLAAKSVAIIDDRTGYGGGLADEVEKAAEASGATVVAREFTEMSATDFTAILTKIKANKPDLIFFGGMDVTAAPMLKQIKKLGITAKFLGGDGTCSRFMAEHAGDEADGFYCSQVVRPLNMMPRGPDFQKRYKDKFNTDVLEFAPYSYDAVLVFAEAMKRANSVDAAKIVAELAKTSIDGVTGKIEFDAKGDLKNGAITVYVVKAGKLKVLEVDGGSMTDKARSR